MKAEDKMIFENCPSCGADVSELGIMEYPIENPYLWYVFCPKCGFSAETRYNVTDAIEAWCDYARGLNERKSMIIKNRDELMRIGVL